MSTPATPAPPTTKPSRFMRWHSRFLGFVLAIVAFELGLFLLFFPWLSTWDVNWVPMHSPRLSSILMSRYFRGALSGLGILNISVGITEFIRQMKSLFGHAGPT